MSVSQPSLLRLIPANVLEATGRSLLSGILLGIKTRVGQQLVHDFESWCKTPDQLPRESPVPSDAGRGFRTAAPAVETSGDAGVGPRLSRA